MSETLKDEMKKTVRVLIERIGYSGVKKAADYAELARAIVMLESVRASLAAADKIPYSDLSRAIERMAS